MPAFNKQPKTGFTLLEIIVSITLLALIALLILRVFNESTKAVGQGRDHVVLDETARLVLDAFEHDVSQALIRTNVAFRIYPDARDGTLYFVSPAVRMYHEDIPRDMAPMSFASSTDDPDSSSGHFVAVETADKTSVETDALQSTRNLIGHSDYYLVNAIEDDFGIVTDATFTTRLTQSVSDDLGNHAALSFIAFVVNGDPDWNYNNPKGLPNTVNRPRFIDVSIGLISAKELNAAQKQNSTKPIANKERIYTRRIFMRNQGTRMLDY